MAEKKAGKTMSRNEKWNPKDIAKDIIFFFLTVAGTFAYVLFILLILSFMFVRYVSIIKLDFEHMLLYSGVAAGISAVWYLVKLFKKK